MTDQRLTWEKQLTDGLRRMDIDLSEQQQGLLLDYLALLLKWNNAFNLTAVRDPAEMVARQLLDSLSILDMVRGPRVLDVGTGPGLPGIPLAIALPDAHFTLLDSNGKKTRFVQQAKTALGLSNVEVVNGRVESFRPDIPFDTVTSRAFAALPKMVELTRHLVAGGGQLLAMKGT
ncbi:MAG: 16S rRNA (guanine(527)-N(7))-methyltransferase RsmG, partial [Sedimenticola sp.]